MEVVLRGAFYDFTGEGIAVRRLALAMHEMGINLKIDIVGEPSDYVDSETHRKLQGLVMTTETSQQILIDTRPTAQYHVSKHFVAKIAFPLSYEFMSTLPLTNLNYKSVIAPSSFVRQVYRASGVPIPIHLVPTGVDLDVFNPIGQQNRPQGAEDSFIFLSVVGKHWNREGADILLQAYLEEFGPQEPVSLVIKPLGYSEDIEGFIKQHQTQMQSRGKSWLPHIHVAKDITSEEELASLYRGSDCFVSPVRYEPMCSLMLESMACGVPVITTGWGPTLEAMGPHSGYLIPFILQPVQNHHEVFPEQLWAEPDVGSLRTILRRVTLHRLELRQRGTRARTLAELRSWADTAAKILEVLEDMRRPQPGKVQTNSNQNSNLKELG